MKIAVFGANGRIGRRVVRLLVDNGHEVRAAVHSSSELNEDEQVTIIQCDIKNKKQVERVLQGSDAVISCLSSWGTEDKNILSTAMRHIIPLMKKHRILKIVTLTGGDVVAKGDELHVLDKMRLGVVKILGGKVYADGQKHLEMLVQSDLDWTVVRSPIMNERGSRTYALTKRRPALWATIHRDAVAASLVEAATSNELTYKAPFIHRS